MSAHGHEPEAASAHEHADHEESDELAPDEPHTPGWLPLLGAALFLAAILLYVVTRPAVDPNAAPSDDTTTAEPAAAAAEPAAVPNPAARNPQIPPGIQRLPARPVPPAPHPPHGDDGHGH